MVGGEYIQKDINLLANDGRLSFIAFLNGAIQEIDFSKVLPKDRQLLVQLCVQEAMNLKVPLQMTCKERYSHFLRRKLLSL